MVVDVTLRLKTDYTLGKSCAYVMCISPGTLIDELVAFYLQLAAITMI